MTTCESVRDSVLQFLQDGTEAISLSGDVCVLSLPIKTLDGAYAEVYIESMGVADYLIHDGGKTIGNLEGSGIFVSERKLAVLANLAKRFGASLDDGVFKSLAKAETVQQAVFSVSQCCSVALYSLIQHHPSFEEDQIRIRITDTVRQWSEDRGIKVNRDVKISGSLKQYTLDFVTASPTPIAINILVPTYGATVSADRYAMQVLDLKGRYVGKRLALLAKPEKWNDHTRKLARKLADRVVNIEDDSTMFPSEIPEALDSLLLEAA
jgi:hypothetical protein